jgi:DNA repair protein RadC
MEDISTMSDMELLFRFVSKGNVKFYVSLLETGNLRNSANMTLAELKSFGISTSNARKLKLVLELAKRISVPALQQGESLESSTKVFEHFHEMLRDEKKEKFYAVLLDCKHRIIGKELISVGALNISIVHPREVFRAAIRAAACSIILIHNHPSGDPNPSQEDVHVTKRLVGVGKTVGIEILDHIIIGRNCYFSFLERGYM